MLNPLPAQGATAMICLVIVLGAVLLTARAARWLPMMRRPERLEGAIALHGVLALDARRRVHLLQAGGSQVLVLTGGVTDVLVRLPSGES